MKRRSTALVVAGLALAGCGQPPMLLTRALLERDDVPRVVPGRYLCDIEAVRGRLDQPPGDRALAMDVTFRDAAEQGLPPHLHAYAQAGAGGDNLGVTFALTPADARPRWPEHYVAGVKPAGIDVRFQDARYFTGGAPAAEITFAGVVERAAVAQVVAGDVSERLGGGGRWAAAALPPGLAPVLRAVRRHPWTSMVDAVLDGTRPDTVRCEPVAWLQGEDRVLAHQQVLLLLQPWRELQLAESLPVGLAVAECALLLRLVSGAGAVAYLRVPLALLREGDDLTLQVGEDGKVRWTRREVWRGRMTPGPGATEGWPAAGLRLAHTRVQYGFDDLRSPSKLPGTIWRVLAAPFAWTLDILGWTNPAIQWVFEQMVDRPPQQPQPQRGNR